MQIDPLFSVISLVILILSVMVHEVSHGYVADRLGDPTARYQGRLTLNPLSHLDLLGSIIVPAVLFFSSGGSFVFGWAKPVPYNPYNLRDQRTGELKIALAGPASNFLIAALAGIGVRLLVHGSLSVGLSLPILALGSVVGTNIVLGLFNLIPVPPLDGSKILYYFLPYRYYHIRETLDRYGFLIVLGVAFFAWGLIYPLVSFLFSLFTGLG